MTTLLNLPDELLEMIARNLQVVEAYVLAATCTHARRVINQMNLEHPLVTFMEAAKVALPGTPLYDTYIVNNAQQLSLNIDLYREHVKYNYLRRDLYMYLEVINESMNVYNDLVELAIAVYLTDSTINNRVYYQKKPKSIYESKHGKEYMDIKYMYIDQFATLLVTYFRNKIHDSRINLPHYLYIICRCKLYDTLCKKTYPSIKHHFTRALYEVSANTCQNKYYDMIKAAIKLNDCYLENSNSPVHYTNYIGTSMLFHVDINIEGNTYTYSTSAGGYILK
jgi:hypothetical protein